MLFISVLFYYYSNTEERNRNQNENPGAHDYNYYLNSLFRHNIITLQATNHGIIKILSAIL